MNASKTYLKSRWLASGYNQHFSHFVNAEDELNVNTNPVFHFHLTSMNLGIRKDFQNDWRLGFNTQYSERSPNVAELFSDGLHHSNAQIELGDLGIQKEKSTKINIWTEMKWQKTTLNINAYVQQINDYVYLKPSGFETTLRGAFPVWTFEQTKAFLMGFDYHLDYQLNKNWSLSHKLAYVQGQDLELNQPLIDMPPLNGLMSLTYHFQSWQLSSQYVFYVTQKRFANFNFETNIINSQNELVPVFVDISTPPKGYQLLNFQMAKVLNLSPKFETKAMLSVNNALNQNYRDYLNRQRFFADELGRNFLLQIQINY